MPNMFVPPAVARELMEQRQEREAEAFRALQDNHHWQWVQEFNADLHRIDHRMKLVWCPDPAPLEAAAAGAQPGRWNLIRHNEGAPMSCLPLMGDDGSYREPGSWVFDKLKEWDLQDPAVVRDRKRRARELQLAKERREAQEDADRQERHLERWLAVSRTQVSMNRDTPWAQNHAGRRGAKRPS